MYKLITEDTMPEYTTDRCNKTTNNIPKEKYTKNYQDTREDPTTLLDQTKAMDLLTS